MRVFHLLLAALPLCRAANMRNEGGEHIMQAMLGIKIPHKSDSRPSSPSSSHSSGSSKSSGSSSSSGSSKSSGSSSSSGSSKSGGSHEPPPRPKSCSLGEKEAVKGGHFGHRDAKGIRPCMFAGKSGVCECGRSDQLYVDRRKPGGPCVCDGLRNRINWQETALLGGVELVGSNSKAHGSKESSKMPRPVSPPTSKSPRKSGGDSYSKESSKMPRPVSPPSGSPRKSGGDPFSKSR